MKIEQVIYFVKIARTGSISLTAEQQHISPPAVSVALSDLENELGVKLFHRTRQGTQLTEQGERLLGEAESILQAWENLKAKANMESNALRGELSLSIVPSLGVAFVPMVVEKFREMFPLIDISLYSGGTNRVIKDIASGKSQIGLITVPEKFIFPQNNYIMEPLFSSNIVAIVNDNYAEKLSSDHVYLKELVEFPLLTFTAEYSSYAALREKIQIFEKKDGITVVESHEMLQQLCLSGMGIGFLPELVASHSVHVQQKKLHIIHVYDLEVVRHYACIYLKNTVLSKVTRALLDNIRHVADIYMQNINVKQ
mgnify:CR=1 FL=1